MIILSPGFDRGISSISLGPGQRIVFGAASRFDDSISPRFGSRVLSSLPLRLQSLLEDPQQVSATNASVGMDLYRAFVPVQISLEIHHQGSRRHLRVCIG